LSFVTTIANKVKCIAETFIGLDTGNVTPGKHARESTSAASGPVTPAATPTAATASSSSSRLDELRERIRATDIDSAFGSGGLVADLGTASIKAHQVHLLQEEIASKEQQLADLQLQLRDCHARIRDLEIVTAPIYAPPAPSGGIS
jgi:hypothetical protein